ncbi:hypothetical protein GL174_08575 [Sphingobium sp. CAP-1]|nr:hypothetical protein GL174_08575 [Sphingobium sp. CAP-1]
MAAADGASLEEAVALIRPFFHDIGWFDALLAREVQAMAANSLHLPGFRASRSGAARHLVLVRTERIWITATVLDPVDSPETRVHFSGRVILCRPLNGARGTRYHLVDGKAVMIGVVRLAAGAVLEMDERREALCLHPDAAPLLFLRAQIAPPGPVHARIHDSCGGAPLRSAQADEGHARALMLLSLLRLQGRRDAAAQFAQALDAPLAGQRWAVMREYLALDTRGAWPALAAMARDEADADVRALAARTMAQIGGAPCPA